MLPWATEWDELLDEVRGDDGGGEGRKEQGGKLRVLLLLQLRRPGHDLPGPGMCIPEGQACTRLPRLPSPAAGPAQGSRPRALHR